MFMKRKEIEKEMEYHLVELLEHGEKVNDLYDAYLKKASKKEMKKFKKRIFKKYEKNFEKVFDREFP
jgi:hypothetical protein